MEVNNLSDVSHPAFSQQYLNEKSENIPTTPPITTIPPEIEINPMKAMLTSDGSIKIIITESDESSADEENSKESSHSQDSGNVKETSNSSSKISKSTDFTSSYDTSILHEDEDDDDEFSQYKQSPRAVFLSTVCHVSENV
jgi:hypothetical protein